MYILMLHGSSLPTLGKFPITRGGNLGQQAQGKKGGEKNEKRRGKKEKRKGSGVFQAQILVVAVRRLATGLSGEGVWPGCRWGVTGF